MANIHWNVGHNENYIILVVSPLQAGFLFQFWDIPNLAKFSKKLAKLVEFTLEKQKLPKICPKNDCLLFTGKAK